MDASTNKLTAPRHLHPTQVGFVCVTETPEGIKVGLVKNLSLIGNITVMRSSQIYILKGKMMNRIIDIRDIPGDKVKNFTKVFLNGEWLGLTNNAIDLYKDLKKMKINGHIENTTGIVFDIEKDEIRVYCDGGRLFRPLFRVKNNELAITKDHLDMISINDTSNPTKITKWNELLIRHPGLIEYVDMEEQYDIEESRKKVLHKQKTHTKKEWDKLENKLNRKGYEKNGYNKKRGTSRRST